MPFMFRDVRVFRGAIFHRQGRHASEGMRVSVKVTATPTKPTLPHSP